MSKAQLWETVFIEDIKEKIDREAGVIRGVKIIGKNSKNGYSYSDHSLKKAVPLYEGIHIYEDHRSKENPKAERKVREKIGWFENVQWKPDGNYGDFHYLKSHPQAEMILEWAERNPTGIGFSHDAEGEMRKDGNGGKYVESINRVRSVDLVGTPATTDSLFESVEDKEIPFMKTTLKKLIESFGSDSEKKHVALLEAAVLDLEVEIAEPGDDAKGVVSEGFKAAYAQLAESSDDIQKQLEQGSKLLAARHVLKTGEKLEEEVIEPPIMQDQEKLQEEVRELKLKLELKELLEEHKVSATPTEMKLLSKLDSKEERVEFIESLKERGKPERSGREEQRDTFDDAKSAFASHRK